MTSEPLLLEAGAQAGPEPTSEPDFVGCNPSAGPRARSPPLVAPAAAAAGAVAAGQPPLTPPLSLAMKWQQAHVQPSQAALRMLRPGAAAMLHAVLVSLSTSLCIFFPGCLDVWHCLISAPSSNNTALCMRTPALTETRPLPARPAPAAFACPCSPQESEAKSLPTDDLEGIAHDFLESLAEVTAQPRPSASTIL